MPENVICFLDFGAMGTLTRSTRELIMTLVDLYFHQSLENLDSQQLFADLVDFFPRNNLVIPSDLFALGRSIVLLQGDGEILDPEFNISEQLAPFF